MRGLTTKATPFALFCFILICSTISLSASDNHSSPVAPTPVQVGVYHPDPNHPWNQLFAFLFARKRGNRIYGLEDLDPLLWNNSRHLLEGQYHFQLIKFLDRFLSEQSDRLIQNPLKRAFLQRDLLAIFNWTVNQEGNFRAARSRLQKRLGRLIFRLALPKEVILSIPSNLWDAIRSGMSGLPPDLLAKNSSWLLLEPKGGGNVPAAQVHSKQFKQSAFLISMRLPHGKNETRDYLRKLNRFPNPLLPPQFPGDNLPPLNPAIVQFPVGTLFANIRQAILVAQNGELVVSPITEVVHLVAHRKISPNTPIENLDTQRDQIYVSFDLDRSRLFRGISGGLVRTNVNKKILPVFGSHGIDPFEDPALWKPEKIKVNCASCHYAAGNRKLPGVHSFQAFARDFSGGPRPRLMSEASYQRVFSRAIRAKQADASWFVLKNIKKD